MFFNSEQLMMRLTISLTAYPHNAKLLNLGTICIYNLGRSILRWGCAGGDIMCTAYLDMQSKMSLHLAKCSSGNKTVSG